MFRLLKIRASIDIFRTKKCKVTFGFKYIKKADIEENSDCSTHDQ